MSRAQALKRARGRAIDRELAPAGIVVRSQGRKTLDEEMPEAYKDVERVVGVMDRAGISPRGGPPAAPGGGERLDVRTAVLRRSCAGSAGRAARPLALGLVFALVDALRSRGRSRAASRTGSDSLSFISTSGGTRSLRASMTAWSARAPRLGQVGTGLLDGLRQASISSLTARLFSATRSRTREAQPELQEVARACSCVIRCMNYAQTAQMRRRGGGAGSCLAAIWSARTTTATLMRLLDTGNPVLMVLAQCHHIITAGPGSLQSADRRSASGVAHLETIEPVPVALRVDAPFAAGDAHLLLGGVHSLQIGQQEGLPPVLRPHDDAVALGIEILAARRPPRAPPARPPRCAGPPARPAAGDRSEGPGVAALMAFPDDLLVEAWRGWAGSSLCSPAGSRQEM